MNLSFDPSAQIIEPIRTFIKQSERVISVTHKPSNREFQQIAYVTAIGMGIIGVIGYIISMTAHFLRLI